MVKFYLVKLDFSSFTSSFFGMCIEDVRTHGLAFANGTGNLPEADPLGQIGHVGFWREGIGIAAQRVDGELVDMLHDLNSLWQMRTKRQKSAGILGGEIIVNQQCTFIKLNVSQISI